MVVPYMDQNTPFFIFVHYSIDELDKSNYLESIVYLSFVHDCVEYVIVIRSVIFKSNHDPQKFFECSKLVMLT